MLTIWTIIAILFFDLFDIANKPILKATFCEKGLKLKLFQQLQNNLYAWRWIQIIDGKNRVHFSLESVIEIKIYKPSPLYSGFKNWLRLKATYISCEHSSFKKSLSRRNF